MNVGIRWCHECYTNLCHNATQVVTWPNTSHGGSPALRAPINRSICQEIHFLLYRYQLFLFHRKPNGRAMDKMEKIKSQGQETQQMLRERILALLLKELVSYSFFFFPVGSSIVGHKTTMSDKISWDTFRKRRFRYTNVWLYFICI